ncbi:MAG TPA: hypothetical protein DDW85_11130 [Porphyromonadaceae bacterium]|nr:hypothetical protein [Porphyromonadaceae bacterium]
MKKNILLAMVAFASLILHAQNHLPESTSICGIWKMTGMATPEGTRWINGTYKIINPDSTYSTFASKFCGLSVVSSYRAALSTKALIRTEKIFALNPVDVR